MNRFFKTLLFISLFTMSFSAFAEQSVRIAVGRFQEEVQIKGQNIKVQLFTRFSAISKQAFLCF